MASAFVIVQNIFLGSIILMAWSIMYKMSNWYRIAEDLTLAIVGGYVFYVGTMNIWRMSLSPLIYDGKIINIIPIGLGLLFLTQITSKWRYLARAPMALIAGVGVGVGTRGALFAEIIAQIKGIATPPVGGLFVTVNHIIAAIATISAIVFFFFTVKTRETGILKPVARLGRVFMMVGFGSIVGSSLMSNSTFMYDKAQWFLSAPYAWVPLVGAIILLVYDVLRTRAS